MLRVLPAQFTIIWVLGLGAISFTRNTSSAPGTLIPVGILMVLYSSKRRTSSTTMSSLASMRCFTSSAESDGVWRLDSTSSPKDLLGTLTSRNNSPPAASHARMPPSKTDTSVKPNAIRRRAANSAKPSPSSMVTMGTSRLGSFAWASYSIRERGRLAANRGCSSAWGPSSRTSKNAIS